jgi:hypothetical protein
MSRTDEIAQTPAPRKGAVTALEAAMAKGGFGGGTQETAGGGLKHKQFTSAMKDACMDVLTKAVKDGELSILECGKIETQINKSLNNPAFQLDQKYVQLLQSKMGK